MAAGDTLEIGAHDALLVVDVQNDFCAGGTLEVPGGAEVVAPINAIMSMFPLIVLTQDWHPAGHMSFASSHMGSKPFDTVQAPYGEQILWPDHCVQGTSGAALHPDLDPTRAALILRKGMDPAIDSYSAFYENDHKTPTGLGPYLKSQGVTRVFLAGLALDFCVGWSAQDAVHEGFKVKVIEDACRAIDTEGSLAETYTSLDELGVTLIKTASLGVRRTA